MRRRDLLKALFAAPIMAALLPQRLRDWEQESRLKAACEEAWAAGAVPDLCEVIYDIAPPDSPFMSAIREDVEKRTGIPAWQDDELKAWPARNPKAIAAVDVYVSDFGTHRIGSLEALIRDRREREGA